MNKFSGFFLQLCRKIRINDWLTLLPLFFPLYLVKIELLGLPFNVLEIIVGGTFLVWVLCRFCSLREKYRQVEDKKFWWWQKWHHNKYFLLISLVFGIVALISTLKVPGVTTLIDGVTIYESKKVALGILKGWILVPYLYMLMLWYSVRQNEFLFKTIYAYVFSALPLVFWAFYQYVTGNFITADGRASGPFVNANYLAMYLAPAVVVLWIMIVRGIMLGFKLPKFLIGAALAILYSIVLLMTQSYGAMMAVLATLLIFMIATFWLHRKYKKKFELELLKKISYFLLAIVVVVVLSAALLFANTQKWQMFTEYQARSSTSVRLEVYDIAWAFVRQNPIFGIGFGQFEPMYNLRAPEILGKAPYEWVMIHPHNTLLAIWLNMGLPGLILFLALILVIFKNYWETYDYEKKFYRLIGISMLLVMLFHGMVDTYLFKNDLAMVFVLVVALCWLPRNMVIQGEVVKGSGLGRKIGMPTANLKIDQSNLDLECLPYGVYGALVFFRGQRYLGAVSYGMRPTVAENEIPTLEVHLIDFEDEMYGETLQIKIVSWIRPVTKFNDLDELKANQKNDLKLIQAKIKI